MDLTAQEFKVLYLGTKPAEKKNLPEPFSLMMELNSQPQSIGEQKEQ